MLVLLTAGFYDLSGTSIVIENLADQLSQSGVSVSIGAIKFKRIPPKGAYEVNTLPIHNISKLKKYLNRFDVIHNHHSVMNYLALISNRPFIYHYHGAPNVGWGNLFRFSMLLSVKLVNRALDAVIAVSESGSTELKRYFSLNNIFVVYNGVNPNLFQHGLEEKHRKGVPQFLFVGNLYEHKRVEEIIFAFKKLIELYPKAHLQIVGEGHAYKKLEKLIKKFNLGDCIELIGRVSDADLPHYYASCDVYTTASRYEVCPVPLIEAMACGKPIVASSIPPHIELITKSKAGTIYVEGDVDNLSKKMIETFEESDGYKNNALRFAKENNWSTVAEKILSVYELVQ